MDSKLEYIARLFKKIHAKGLETYVITRFWHLLNDDDVKLVPQQYVAHSLGEYALTDIYLPQLKIHVEINEPGHYGSAEKINFDRIREVNIIHVSGHQIFTIDCTQTIDNVHIQIDHLIDLVKDTIRQQRLDGTFKSWQPDFEYKAAYYKPLKYLNVADDPALETIEQICELFEIAVPKMGFLRKGAKAHNTMKNTIIWWPSSYNPNWKNSISEDGSYIIEKAVNEKNPGEHAAGILNNPHTRITFFKDRDILGYTLYRFKGVFELDTRNSNAAEGLRWVKVSNTIVL
jgi:hypothetical protein